MTTIVLCLALSLPAAAQSPEWKALSDEMRSLYQKGRYDRAQAAAQKSLDLAVQEKRTEVSS